MTVVYASGDDTIRFGCETLLLWQLGFGVGVRLKVYSARLADLWPRIDHFTVYEDILFPRFHRRNSGETLFVTGFYPTGPDFSEKPVRSKEV